MQLPKITTTPLETMSTLQLRRVNNRRRGLDTAWSNANEFISLKKGYPLMIAGVGGSGKTEVAFDIMINASLMYGWWWLVLSPETGDQYEIIEALVEKMANGAVLEKTSQYAMSDKKFDQIMKWLNDHFRILDPTEHWKETLQTCSLTLKTSSAQFTKKKSD